jgi:hypothetical protein
VKELMDYIDKSKDNVLIATFSQQRNQDVLLTIIEENNKKGIVDYGYKILLDAPLGKKVSDKYIKHAPEIYKLLDE